MIASHYPYSIDLRGGGSKRTPGVHASGVIKVIAKETSAIKAWKEDLEELELDELIRLTPYDAVGNIGILMRIIIGLAWEDWLGPRLKPLGVKYHPGELSYDGIVGTPDGIGTNPYTGLPEIHEIKATFMSAKRLAESIDIWMWQVQTYLVMLSEETKQLCTTAVIHPLYIRGDYTGIDPLYLPRRVQFEEEELESTWSMIQRYKDRAKPEK